MSSDYKLLCMSHSPALVIDRGDCQNWQEPEPAIAAALDPAKYGVEEHVRCDLLIGRFSYPLIEVCCAGGPRGRTAHAVHTSPTWLDKQWLVLLHAAMAAPADPGLKAALEPLQRRHSCWSWERLDRLAPHLGIGD